MSSLLPHRLSLLALVVLAFTMSAATASAAPEIEVGVDGTDPSIGTDPSTGRTLVVWARPFTNAAGGPEIDLHARVVGEDGRAAAAPRRIGGGALPSLLSGGGSQLAAIGSDTRRHRQLVAWAGMGSAACKPIPAEGSLYPPICASRDKEIFTRLLDRNGRPLGPEIQMSEVGPRGDARFSANAPTLAYDRRADSYLLVYAAQVTTDQSQAALFVQRIKRSGYPDGPPAVLAVQPQPLSTLPVARLAADPRGGFLLAYVWGPSFDSRGLFAQRLTAAGRLVGAPKALRARGGRGAGSFELAFDQRRRRALLVSSPGAPGSSGFQAQQLRASGAPATRPVSLPFRGGRGNVYVAADPRRPGWSFSFVREEKRLVSHVYIQRANAAGRPLGRARLVTSPDGRSFAPRIGATRKGTFVVAWGDEGYSCTGNACYGGGSVAVKARLIRP